MSSDGSESAEFFDARPGDETLGVGGRLPRPAGQSHPQPPQQQHLSLPRPRSHSRGRTAAEPLLPPRRSSPPQTDVPPTPAIPARFLKDSSVARPASIAAPSERRRSTLLLSAADLRGGGGGGGVQVVSGPAGASSRARSLSASRKRSSTTVLPSDRARVSNAIIASATPNSKSAVSHLAFAEKQRAESLPTAPIQQVDVDVRTLSKLESRAVAPSQARRESEITMSRTTGRSRSRSRHRDFFLEVAADNDVDDNMGSDDELGQRLRSSSRASYSGKRRSLPADMLGNNANDRRPSTSGQLYSRPSSRLHTNRASTDLQRHIDQYKSPTNRTAFAFGDTASVSGQSNSARSRRYSAILDRSPASPSRFRDRLQLSEASSRSRPSFGATVTPNRTMESFEEESPAEDLEDQKQADSTSNESQPAETVWDELDDLKSRIKSLEFNGQAPASSSAAASGNSSDRPRTATTAPTTIGSSPKNTRKAQAESKKATPTPSESASTAKTRAHVHPALHTALEKARPLLNATLMRTLDATASDALQLAAITSNAASQSDYSAAPIPISDRHVRRKIDNVCRNLTELCLTLSEGKYEAPNVLASPAPIIETLMQDSPLVRYSSGNFSQRNNSVGRAPMSRLEARKSSILGNNTIPLADNVSPRGSLGDVPSGQQQIIQAPVYLQQPRRASRAPSSAFSSRSRQEDVSVDEDVNFRPPSRAMTDIGAVRSKSRIANENRPPAMPRTPSLRETLTINTNEAAFERNRETPRTASIGSGGRRRRLFDNESTPPVMEEEAGSSEYHTPSQPRRRITSLGHYSTDHYSSRKSDLPGRTTSLSQRRRVIVE